MTDLFNNRETATGIWLAIVVFFGVRHKGIREACGNVLKSLWRCKIVVSVVLMILHIVLCVVLLGQLALWNASHLKETIYWFLCSGFVLFMNLMTDRDHAAFFRKTILDCFKVMVFIQFLIGFYPLPLTVELLLVPLLAFLAVGSAYAGTKPEYAPVKKLFDSALALIGVAVLAHVSKSIHQQYVGLLKPDVIRSMLLPLWLTLLFLPFLYIVRLIADYETLFIRLPYFVKRDDDRLLAYVKRRIMMLCHFNLRRLSRFSKDNLTCLHSITDKDRVDEMFTNFQMEGTCREEKQE